MKIVSVVGARPNFMKMASLDAAFKKSRTIQNVLVHTGQHYDKSMNQIFFEELKLPKPNQSLNVGSGSHAEQTAEIMKRFDPLIEEEKPDAVLVVGDVNSTIACALVAAKRNIPVAHVEAGLRSFDRRMPEEINRILTDHLSKWLFTTSHEADNNLAKEGITKNVHLVGNTMVDCLLKFKPLAEKNGIREKLGVTDYGLVTLHRAANVDEFDSIKQMVEMLELAATYQPLVFSIHPRTRKQIAAFGMGERIEKNARIILTEPLGYLEFLNLQIHSKFILTDSGGIQEEATVLKVPCLTARENTERPETVSRGTNTLVGRNMDALRTALDDIESGNYKKGETLPFWDGKAGERICRQLEETG